MATDGQISPWDYLFIDRLKALRDPLRSPRGFLKCIVLKNLISDKID